ncbi:MAG: hypothetical protein JJU13_08310 [Balneolaceae bacterium]|nr:hypothetical protein [Balneolaceae bacterium]
MTLQELVDLLNNNQGVLSLILFVGTIFIGWFTGIFRALIKKPKFKINVVPKMSFGSVFLTGQKYTPPGHGTYDVHQTAFVLYLEITNIGSAASNLGEIEIGYFKDDGKSTFFQRRLWIKESNILDDFIIPSADGQVLRVPHLKQVNFLYGETYNGFLEVGQSIVGAAYFEQYFSWGNNYPRVDKERNTDLKIKVKDAFDRTFTKKIKVPIIDIEEAEKYNHKFGQSHQLIDSDKKSNLNFESEKHNEGDKKSNKP